MDGGFNAGGVQFDEIRKEFLPRLVELLSHLAAAAEQHHTLFDGEMISGLPSSLRPLTPPGGAIHMTSRRWSNVSGRQRNSFTA